MITIATDEGITRDGEIYLLKKKLAEKEKAIKEAVELLKFIESRNCPSGINEKVFNFLKELGEA